MKGNYLLRVRAAAQKINDLINKGQSGQLGQKASEQLLQFFLGHPQFARLLVRNVDS